MPDQDRALFLYRESNGNFRASAKRLIYRRQTVATAAYAAAGKGYGATAKRAGDCTPFRLHVVD